MRNIAVTHVQMGWNCTHSHRGVVPSSRAFPRPPEWHPVPPTLCVVIIESQLRSLHLGKSRKSTGDYKETTHRVREKEESVESELDGIQGQQGRGGQCPSLIYAQRTLRAGPQNVSLSSQVNTFPGRFSRVVTGEEWGELA